jgi:hypothetical protein
MRYLVIGAGFALALSAMFAFGAANAAAPLMSDGKCWVNNNEANFKWGACEKEVPAPKVAHARSKKGSNRTTVGAANAHGSQ